MTLKKETAYLCHGLYYVDPNGELYQLTNGPWVVDDASFPVDPDTPEYARIAKRIKQQGRPIVLPGLEADHGIKAD